MQGTGQEDRITLEADSDELECVAAAEAVVALTSERELGFEVLAEAPTDGSRTRTGDALTNDRLWSGSSHRDWRSLKHRFPITEITTTDSQIQLEAEAGSNPQCRRGTVMIRQQHVYLSSGEKLLPNVGRKRFHNWFLFS